MKIYRNAHHIDLKNTALSKIIRIFALKITQPPTAYVA